MRTPSVRNSLYFVTFIDDFSRFCWVYPLKAKSDVFAIFQHYVSMVENETGCKVQTLRTDRGGEYMSGAFKDFLGKKGIKHQCTMPYTPQQNGVAERKNMSLMEMARCMLKAKSLPHKLWMEAVACATHVLNRCPTRALKTITPYESWYDKRPSVSYLRVFGCLAYAHIPQQLRGKLDDKAVKCILVGYSSGSKGYKLYNPATNKIFESRDVIFAEPTAQPMVAFDVPHMQTQNVFEGFLPSFVENQESQQVDNFDQSFNQHVTPHDVEEIVREEQEVLREEQILPKWVQKTLQDSKLDAPVPRKTRAGTEFGGDDDVEEMEVVEKFDVHDRETEVPLTPTLSSFVKSPDMQNLSDDKRRKLDWDMLSGDKLKSALGQGDTSIVGTTGQGQSSGKAPLFPFMIGFPKIDTKSRSITLFLRKVRESSGEQTPMMHTMKKTPFSYTSKVKSPSVFSVQEAVHSLFDLNQLTPLIELEKATLDGQGVTGVLISDADLDVLKKEVFDYTKEMWSKVAGLFQDHMAKPIDKYRSWFEANGEHKVREQNAELCARNAELELLRKELLERQMNVQQGLQSVDVQESLEGYLETIPKGDVRFCEPGLWYKPKLVMIEDEYEEQKNVPHVVDEPRPSTRTISGPSMAEESTGSVYPWSGYLRDKNMDEKGKKKKFEESFGDESFDEEHGLPHLRTPDIEESRFGAFGS
ncbi:hypothetical protein L7F22_044362 [Adiantum nelumboides]|nr:hypothetical protein [Adiantum nelumboides]